MKASGMLFHCWFSEYYAVVTLAFCCPESAAAVLPVLGEPWQIAEGNARVLVARLNSPALHSFKSRWSDAIEIHPCGFPGCQEHHTEIDHVDHSIDHGASWDMEIPAVPLNQLSLVLTL